MFVRDQQVNAFRQEAIAQWLQRLSDYAAKSFPEETARMGVATTRELARYAIHRARDWGLVRENEVAGFLAMLILLSPTFDTDPEFAWAQGILGSEATGEVRMQRLWIGATRLMRMLAAG